MNEQDDFARELRTLVDETIPTRDVPGLPALARVKSRSRARAARATLVSTACVALVAVGAVGLRPGGVAQSADASPEGRTVVEPYEGGAITEEHYKAIVQHAADCMTDRGFPAGPVEKRFDGVSYGFSLIREDIDYESEYPALIECESEVNLMEAEVAYTEQQRLNGVDREKAFTQFAECLEYGGVTVTPSDDEPTVSDKIRAATDAGGPGPQLDACFNAFSVRLYG